MLASIRKVSPPRFKIGQLRNIASYMLAAQYSENSDDISVVQVKRVPKPVPAPGQLVVKVHSAAVNPVDVKVLKGIPTKGFGWSMPLPFTVGYDFAGVVDEVPESDTSKHFAVGDRVFAVNWGTRTHQDADEPAGGAFAEYILVEAKKVSKIPDCVSFDQAAAVALAGSTAHQATFEAAKLKAGDRVLILGGPTAVGQIAIQLAKERGAWVATTASTRNLEYVAQFGADLVVDYKTQHWEKIPELKNLDAVIDTAGEKDGFARVKAGGVVKPTGAFVTIASADAGFDPAGHPPLHFAARFALVNSPAVQDELASKVASGVLKITIDETFPFTTEGVQNILRKVGSATSNGKNILKVV